MKSSAEDSFLNTYFISSYKNVFPIQKSPINFEKWKFVFTIHLHQKIKVKHVKK